MIQWLKNLFRKKDQSVFVAPAAPVVVKPPSPTRDWIADLIVAECRKWVGVRENGSNKGTEVEMFQKATDGRASGEAWCMAFVQFVVRAILKQLGLNKNPFHASEHCLTVWNNTPEKYRSQVGGRGMVPIWRHGSTSSGHTGVSLDSGKVTFKTIEGNTNSAGSREGDGVYDKTRYMLGGSMKLVGFIDLPQMLLDITPDLDIITKT